MWMAADIVAGGGSPLDTRDIREGCVTPGLGGGEY